MSDIHSWQSGSRHRFLHLGEDPGPAAAQTVAWQMREQPGAEIYEVLEMLALLPDQDATLRNTNLMIRNPDKEKPCSREKSLPRRPD